MIRRCEPDAHPWRPIDGTHQSQCADCGVWADVDENPAAATESATVSGVRCETIEAAPGGASTPLVRGPRPSDLAEGLPSMIATEDAQERASAVDGCPSCIANTEPPRATEDTAHGFIAHYLCTDCGHRWSTAWAA